MKIIINLSLKQNYAVDVLFKNWIAATLKFYNSKNLQQFTIYGSLMIGFNCMYY